MTQIVSHWGSRCIIWISRHLKHASGHPWASCRPASFTACQKALSLHPHQVSSAEHISLLLMLWVGSYCLSPYIFWKSGGFFSSALTVWIIFCHLWPCVSWAAFFLLDFRAFPTKSIGPLYLQGFLSSLLFCAFSFSLFIQKVKVLLIIFPFISEFVMLKKIFPIPGCRKTFTRIAFSFCFSRVVRMHAIY